MALERLEAAVVVGPDEVHDTITRPFSLLAGGGHDAMPAGGQRAVGELDRGVAQVHDRATRLRPHPEPLAGVGGLVHACFPR